MSDTPISKTHFAIAGTVFFVYLLFVGVGMRAGHDVPSGFYRPHVNTGPKFVNNLADTYGSDVIGNGLIGFAIIGGGLFAIWI